MKNVACGNFVKRQTPESGYSHFNSTWEHLEMLVNVAMRNKNNIIPGYKDGVVLISLPPKLFVSAIVELDEESKLTASYGPRRPGEASYIRVSTKAKKQPAKYVSVVLYRHDVLEENNERETDAEWEIVAIKARVSVEEEPMDPMTMARNFLHLPGGTKGSFTALQFAESIVYWNHHTLCQGKPKWYRRIINLFK